VDEERTIGWNAFHHTGDFCRVDPLAQSHDSRTQPAIDSIAELDRERRVTAGQDSQLGEALLSGSAVHQVSSSIPIIILSFQS
jgi:hypothetical protein